MNCAVFYRRFGSYAQRIPFERPFRSCRTWRHGAGHFLLTSSFSLLGRRVWRVLATLVVLFSRWAPVIT